MIDVIYLKKKTFENWKKKKHTTQLFYHQQLLNSYSRWPLADTYDIIILKSWATGRSVPLHLMRVDCPQSTDWRPQIPTIRKKKHPNIRVLNNHEPLQLTTLKAFEVLVNFRRFQRNKRCLPITAKILQSSTPRNRFNIRFEPNLGYPNGSHVPNLWIQEVWLCRFGNFRCWKITQGPVSTKLNIPREQRLDLKKRVRCLLQSCTSW